MVEDIFATHIKGNKIMLSDNVSVDIAKFKEVFGNENITYNNLIRIDNGDRGYKNFFNRCKAQGILN